MPFKKFDNEEECIVKCCSSVEGYTLKLLGFMQKLLLVVLFCGGMTTYLFGGPALSENWSDQTLTGKYVAGGATASENDISLFGGLIVSGDVYIINELPMTHEDDYLDIQTGSDTFILPDPASYGHLIIYTGECCKTLFTVNNDLIFSGYNDVGATTKKSLTITFSGSGQVEFYIKGGKQVAFESLIGGLAPPAYANEWSDFSIDYTYASAAGTRVYITMDQTYSQAIEHGQSKVMFTKEVSQLCGGDTTKITIGRNSLITYLSDNDTGLLSESDAVGYGSIAFDPSCEDAGRMLLHIRGSSFTDSNGSLFGSLYEDGAFVVAGHYVSDLSSPDTIRTSVEFNKPAGVESVFRIVDETNWRYSSKYKDGSQSPADLYKNPETGEPVFFQEEEGPEVGEEGSFQDPSRRGLLVVNECKTVPLYAADPYVNNMWAEGNLFGGALTEIRQGFVLGINGSVEIFHNTFLDYVGVSNQEFYAHKEAYSGFLISANQQKKHNPSAFLVDGLSLLDKNNFDPNDPYKLEDLLHYPYVANLELYGGRHAQILLRGDARMYMRSGAMSNDYVDVGADWYTDPSSLGGYFVSRDIEGCLLSEDRVYSFTINSDGLEGVYDGTLITGYASDGSLTYQVLGEGNNVLDIEGKLTIRSTDDKNTTNDSGFVLCKQNTEFPLPNGTCYFDRHPTTSADARGGVNLPPVKIDFLAREIFSDESSDLTSRPLTIDKAYPCYNSSSVFLNNEMALHNVNWHHNDVLKNASVDPNTAEPVFVGGEKAYYDDLFWNELLDDGNPGAANTLFVENAIENINRKVPLVSLYTSTLFLHESMVVTGLRFVITDKFLYEPSDVDGNVKLASNISCIMCYNHGDPLDTFIRGYGRSLLLGTDQNLLASGHNYSSSFLDSAYLNIYRGWHTLGNSDVLGDRNYLVRLSLETDAQPRYTMQYATRQTNPSSAGSDSFSKLYDDTSLLADNKRVATQVFYLGNNSFTSVGWTTTNGDQVIAKKDFYPTPDYSTDGSYSYSFGINEGFRPRPWDAEWSLGTRYDVDGSVLTTTDFRFSLTSDDNDAAELYISGDNYYFGGKNTLDKVASEPVVTSADPSVFYANHGGKIHINQTDLSLDENNYYNCFVDTVFAYKPWPRILQPSTNAYIDGLSGQVELPHDQVKFARSIQPYSLDFQTMLLSDDQTKEGNVRLSVYNDGLYGSSPVDRRRASGEEVTIPWNYRTDKSTRIGTEETSPKYIPLKSFMTEGMLGLNRDFKKKVSDRSVYRSTKLASQVGAVDMPDALLTVSTGDNITQMRVSGATKADPFHLYVTGGSTGYGAVREFTSLASDDFTPGEGCHAAIIVDGGGHFGLGSRNWNEHSKNAWSILGDDYVTIYPNGNGFVWINSNLLVHDRLAIIPTKNFGSYGNEKQVLINPEQAQRLTFYSQFPYEIRIPEGKELDLSAFGFPEAGGGTVGADDPHQIEIAGKLKLIFEPGSRLRFPQDPTHQPVLYINDEAEIIFEGVEDRDLRTYNSFDESSPYRTKILGAGKIWLNKNAKMRVNDNAHVCVETDSETWKTDVDVSIQRQAKFYIGDENVSGGAFQIGNPTDLTTSGSVPEIYFGLYLGGLESRLGLREDAEFVINREGFLGLAVGAKNKNGAPNGNWQLQGLYNVQGITLALYGGTFDHNQIFDGDSRQSSLIGIGPSYYNFLISYPERAIVKGGGNLINIPDAGDVYPSVLGGSLIGSTTGDGSALGDVGILSTTGHIVQGDTSVGIYGSGFFSYLSMPDITTFSLTDVPYVALCRVGGETFTGHVDGSDIMRMQNPSVFGELSLESSFRRGSLKAAFHRNGSTAFDRLGSLTVSSI